MIGVAALFALLLAGCGSSPRPLQGPAGPEATFVFGHVDVSDAPCPLEWFSARKVVEGREGEIRRFRVDGGDFFAENVPLGSYWLWECGGRTFTLTGSGTKVFEFRRPFPELRLDGPGVHFAGSFRVRDQSSILGKKYLVERASAPSEADLLRRLLPRVQGTAWEDQVRRRLETLGR